MKKLYIFIIILLLPFSTIAAKEYAVTIKISSTTELKTLQAMVTGFDDVKVTPGGKFIYNQDNYYATAICTESQLRSLRNSNFTIEKTIQYTKSEPEQDNRGGTVPYQFGWPRQSSVNAAWYESSPSIADMDGNGSLEIFATHSFAFSGNPLLYGFKPTGAFVLGFPFLIPFGSLQSSGSVEIPALGDIDGDGEMEVVHADENGMLYAHNFDGSAVTGFPVSTGGANEHTTPALVDVNNDGKAEIIITSRNRDNDLNAKIHVYTHTGTAVTQLPGFPVDYHKGSASGPAVADVDNDGLYEIFVGTGYASGTYDARILCYTHDGNVKPGWPVMTGPYSVGSAVTLHDLNNDNKLDAVLRVKILSQGDVNGIYAFDYQGNLLPNFPFPVPSGHPDACVSIGDIDNDNEVEIGFGTVLAVSRGEVIVWNLDGTTLPGFPRRVYATWVDGSTAMADISGDGIPDIVAPTNKGKVYAFNMTGDSVSGFPVSSEATFLNGFNTSPTLVDIDGDGDVEIFAPCNDRKIYCWDTPGLYDSSKTWSTYKGNASRNGTQYRDILVGINPVSSSVPEKYMLAQNFPNPFNPATNIKFSIAGNTFAKLSVYNSVGQKVAELINENLSPGEYSVRWNAVSAPSGVYLYKLETKDFSETRKMLLIK